MSDELTAAVEENLLQALDVWARASAGGEVCQEEGFLLASSRVPIRSFNNVLLTRTPVNSRALHSQIKAYFERRGVPFRLRVREAIAASADEVLVECGLRRKGGIPSLVLAPVSGERGAIAPLEIRRVADRQTLRQHVEVVAAGFDWSPDMLSQVFSEALLHNGSWRGYVGYVEGRLVASSQLITTNGVAGIYYVATLDEFRRRGFGEAMTRHALHEGAAAGCTMASLQASPLGQPIYERMGFRQVSYYRTYVCQEV